MPKKKVSLGFEVELLMQAVRAARMLTDQLRDGAIDMRDARSMPIAISAVLSVVDARLLMLQRVVAGSVDAALLWCVKNASDETSETDEADEDDVIFAAWSDKLAAKNAKAEYKRTKRRLAYRNNQREKKAA